MKSYIHRDIKPDNFVVGLGSKDKAVYIIDYGLAKRYRDDKTNMHISFRENKKLTGTARFASLVTHLGGEQSRRDDLECLGYTAIYLLNGGLPWQGVQGECKHDKYEKIKEMKARLPFDKMGKEMPLELKKFMLYCRELKFEDKPDYKALKQMFRESFMQKQDVSNFSPDWNILTLNPFIGISTISSIDETNMADCPDRKLAFSRNTKQEIKLGELSTPRTIPSVHLLGGGSQQKSSKLDFMSQEPGNEEKPLSLPSPLEQKNQEEAEAEAAAAAEAKPLEQKKEEETKVITAEPQAILKKIESTTCDFKQEDIIEDNSLYGILKRYCNINRG
jgi:serine/threonine protein kinase